jgi:CheY-like chemotaxis protein
VTAINRDHRAVDDGRSRSYGWVSVSPGTTPHHVLVIEDDPDIRDAVQAILECEGYDVTTADNGARALSQLRESPPPCLIVLDLMMPVMTGWEFCVEKNKDPSLAEIPVVVVSAITTEDPRFIDTCAVDYVPKPIDFERLLRVLDRHC